jgi:hypothetical protein
MIRIRGIAKREADTQSFSLSIPVSIPPATRLPLVLLAGTVESSVDEDAGLWSYTVHNQETGKSAQTINSFQVRFRSPFVVRSTPPRWTFQTDNLTYVLWRLIDSHHPASGVPAGDVLKGVQIQSPSRTSEGASWSLTSWDAVNDQPGLLSVGTVLAPGHTD